MFGYLLGSGNGGGNHNVCYADSISAVACAAPTYIDPWWIVGIIVIVIALLVVASMPFWRSASSVSSRYRYPSMGEPRSLVKKDGEDRNG